LALVFGAANAYLGIRAGQTVAATIPAEQSLAAGAVYGTQALAGAGVDPHGQRGSRPVLKAVLRR